jgi:very-short-patch-repair endonuclease
VRLPLGPFIGAEALRNGEVNRHQLRTRFRAILPGVYLPIDRQPSLYDRSCAAWLWSGRTGVIAGLAASALHGSKWIDADTPIDLICNKPRPAVGLRVHRDRLSCHEIQRIGGLPVTSVARTAFDLGRGGTVGVAVARLDALMNVTGLAAGVILDVAADHPRRRGLRQLETVLDLVDPGAQSPKESWLRLVLVEAGLPRPRTQIPVRSCDGWSTYYLDMGWEDIKVAVEYDGDHHRTDRVQYAKDIHRLEDLERLGWIAIRVLATDTAPHIVRRVRAARERRSSVR